MSVGPKVTVAQRERLEAMLPNKGRWLILRNSEPDRLWQQMLSLGLVRWVSRWSTLSPGYEITDAGRAVIGAALTDGAYDASRSVTRDDP